MASLEELLTIALQGGQAQIKADDPYASLASTGDQIGGLFSQAMANPTLASGKNATRDAILGSALSGLFGGAMGGMSQNYQADRQGKYQDLLRQAMEGTDVSGSTDVTSGLAKQAQNQANLMNSQRAFRELDQEQTLNNDIKRTAAANALSINPNLGNSVLEKVLGIPTQQTEMAESVDPNRSGEGRLIDEIKNETRALINSGIPPTQAGAIARSTFEARQKELTDSYKKVDEAALSGESLLRMVDNLEASADYAGNTGQFGGIRQGVAGILGGVGLEGQERKYQAGKTLQSLGAEIVRNARQVGSGPMSDRDVQMYLQSGPLLTNPEGTNQDIINRMRFAGKIQSGYADFMREQRGKGTPVYEAETQWSSIVKENPYFVTDKQSGKLQANPNWEIGLGGGAPVEAIQETQGNVEIDIPAMIDRLLILRAG